jgi:DNA-binding SARP family transcriptional activator
VQVSVSRLRKKLGANNAGDCALITRTPGYVLQVEPGELDLQRFEELLAEGRRARADGDAELAAMALHEAGGLWRGQPLADLEAGGTHPAYPAGDARDDPRVRHQALRGH